MKDFITIGDCTAAELRHFMNIAKQLKEQFKKTGRNDPILAGKILALVFEKPSLRTRVSFTAAMMQLGGSVLMLRGEEVGLGVREPVQDVARVLSGMINGIMARTFDHANVVALAKYATVPVINGLTDYSHPCQAMADLMTIEEHFGSLEGRTIAFIGDGNNVARSLATACTRFGMRLIVAAPPGYELDGGEIERITPASQKQFQSTHDPVEAVKQADVLYTDTWVSMGQEQEKEARVEAFAGFTIDEKLLAAAPAKAIVLHCLPAYRGLEITDSVMEGPRSRVFQQAENRLHFQKALLAVLMAGK
jgi:ornithine carbamoyltransferase